MWEINAHDTILRWRLPKLLTRPLTALEVSAIRWPSSPLAPVHWQRQIRRQQWNRPPEIGLRELTYCLPSSQPWPR